MKKIFGAILGFYFIVFCFAAPIYSFIFPWGGATETHLHPIYFGLIVLSVMIVISTSLILEEIRDLKKEIKESYNSDKEEK